MKVRKKLIKLIVGDGEGGRADITEVLKHWQPSLFETLELELDQDYWDHDHEGATVVWLVRVVEEPDR